MAQKIEGDGASSGFVAGPIGAGQKPGILIKIVGPEKSCRPCPLYSRGTLEDPANPVGGIAGMVDVFSFGILHARHTLCLRTIYILKTLEKRELPGHNFLSASVSGCLSIKNNLGRIALLLAPSPRS